MKIKWYDKLYVWLLISFGFISIAWAADQAINARTELAEAPNAADVIPIYDTSTTAGKSLGIDNLFLYLGAAHDTAAELTALFAAKEVQLDNEAGLYAVLSDVTDFWQLADFTTRIGAAYDTSAELDALFGAKYESGDEGTIAAAIAEGELADSIIVTADVKDGTLKAEDFDFTNLSVLDFTGESNWKVWYSDGSGDVKEVALGGDGTYLKSNGAAVAPTFATPAGAGDVTAVGDCATGDCLDGTSDGGTQILLYDAQGATTVVVGDNAAAITLTLPTSTGTLITSAANTIDSDQYVDGSIDLAHMSANSIDSDQYVDASIDVAHMSVNSIDSDQYVDGSIDVAHMSANSIDSDQYVDGSIDAVHLAADIIDETKIADDGIDSEHYNDGSIDLAHMSVNSIDSDQYVDGSIDVEHMSANSIDSDSYVDASIDNAHLADNAVGVDEIATDAVTMDAVDADGNFTDLTGNWTTTGVGTFTTLAAGTGGLTSTATAPTVVLQDSTDAAGTAQIQGMSSGGTNAVVMTLEVEEAGGSAASYLEMDGANSRVEVKASSLEISDGVIFIKEQAEADADRAAYGQIWINTATPNELWWTDDAGSDTRLGLAGGTVNVSGTPVANDIAQFTDANTIKGMTYAELGAIAGFEDAIEATIFDADAQTVSGIWTYSAAPVITTGVAEGTDALTITSGDVTLTDGDLTLTAGDAIFGEDVTITGNTIVTGTMDTGAHTATSYTADASASPQMVWDDSGTAITDDAGIIIASNDTNDTEDTDVTFYTQINSVWTAWMFFDPDPSGAGADPLLNIYHELKIADGKAIRFDEAAADPNDADVKLSAADGKLTITGVNGANNEDISFDVDVTANEVVVSSSTGVTNLNFSAINLVTTGTISGAIPVIVTTDGSESPTAAQMNGSFFVADHATAANDTDYTLPTAVAGMCACFYDNGAGDGGIIIDAAASDEILLNGTGIGAAEAIDSPGVAGAGANGDFICLLAIDATNWITLGSSGTWVDGGAD